MTKQDVSMLKLLPNPYLRVFPIKEVSDIGRKYNIPLIMDNTASPVICRPIRTWSCRSYSFINEIYWRSWNSYWWMFSRWRKF